MNYEIDYERYKDPVELRKLWEAAHIDNLTRLYNRYGMESWITAQLEQQKCGQVSALLIIDVDNFKTVNDTYGHMLGDAVLVEIADLIREVFSDEYFCGRVGGDEYQIFVKEVKEEKLLLEKAGALCLKVKEQYEKKNSQYGISLSIGIAFAAGTEYTYGKLYQQADLALYQAKDMGKNGYSVYSDTYVKPKTAQKQKRQTVRKEHVEQIGESGFSLTKILLDHVIRILKENKDPKTAIEKVSRAIVDAFDVTRAYASCYTEDGTHLGKSYFYAQNTDKNIKPNLALSAREYEAKCFNKDHIFFCTDIEHAVEPLRTELKRMGVQTLLQVMIFRDGKILGTLGINNCGYKRLWLQSEIEVIHTIALLMEDHIYRLQQES